MPFPTNPSVLDDFTGPAGTNTNWSIINGNPVTFSAISRNGSGQGIGSNGALFAWDYFTPAGIVGPDSESFLTLATTPTDAVRTGCRVFNQGTVNYSGYFVSVSATGVWTIIRITNGGAPATLVTGPTQLLLAGHSIGIQAVGSVLSAWWNNGAWTQMTSYDVSGDVTKYLAAGLLAIEFKSPTIETFGGGPYIVPAQSLTAMSVSAQLRT